jgi:hypothetical protein
METQRTLAASATVGIGTYSISQNGNDMTERLVRIWQEILVNPATTLVEPFIEHLAVALQDSVDPVMLRSEVSSSKAHVKSL